MTEFVDRLVARADEEGLLDVAYATLDTPLGTALVAATPRGVVRVALPNEDAESVVAELAEHVSPRVLEYPARLDQARRELDQYFEHRRQAFELPLDWCLSHPGFYRRVLRATRRVPLGAVITYGDAAAQAGNPRAFRAAGTALATNPLPIVVPCHRVIRAGGELGNYGGGPEMKRFLLELEGALPDR
jgi:methylated-DNA-[protein]-cysteine S-methyltransferase